MSMTDVRLTTVRIARVVSYLVYFFVLASLVILVLGFFLKLFAANPDAAFTEWAYRNLDRTMEPFRGIFPAPVVNDAGSVFDVSILFAMIIYSLVGLAVSSLLDWLTGKMQALDRQRALEERLAAMPPGPAGPGTTVGGEDPTATPPGSVPPSPTEP